MDMSKARNECRYYDSCSAPFCPLDTVTNGNAVWFPDEEICIVNEPPYWVERQVKLSKRTKDRDTCYTFGMVKWRCMIKKNINGIESPDTLPKQKKAERVWMVAHKLKKPLSMKEREERCKRLENARRIRLDILNRSSK